MKLRPFCLAILTLFLLTGCSLFRPDDSDSRTVELPFTTIAQSDPYGVSPRLPSYLVLRQPEEWKSVVDRFPAQAIDAGSKSGLPQAGPVVAVYAGVQPSSGYSVEIKSVTRQARQVFIVVQIIPPAPDQITEPSESLPFHIVSVATGSVDSWDGYTIQFKDEKGNLLEQVNLSK